MTLTKKQKFSRLADFITGKKNTLAPQRIRPQVKSKQMESGSGGVAEQCLTWLKKQELFYPIFSRRLNNGAGDFGGGFRQYGIRGGYDINCTIAGKTYWIEVKSGKGGILSTVQQKFKAEQERAGAVCLEVCSLDELKQALEPILTPLADDSWGGFLADVCKAESEGV